MSDIQELHKDLRENSKEIKALVEKIGETNSMLVKVIADNNHRDTRLDTHDKNIEKLFTSVSEIKQQRVKDREENQPVIDRARKNQEQWSNRANYMTTVFIVVLCLIVIAAIANGSISLGVMGAKLNTETSQAK